MTRSIFSAFPKLAFFSLIVALCGPLVARTMVFENPRVVDVEQLEAMPADVEWRADPTGPD